MILRWNDGKYYNSVITTSKESIAREIERLMRKNISFAVEYTDKDRDDKYE